MHYYVYRITCLHPDSKEKYYYGFRSCKCIPTKDTNYWSSSRYVKQSILNYGLEFFKKKIIKTFSDRKLAINYEIKLHEKFDVRNHPLFFNKSNQSIWGCNFSGYMVKGKTYEEIFGKEKAEQLKKLRSISTKGKNNKGMNNPMFGKTHSDKVKEKLSSERQGSNHPTWGWVWITDGINSKKIKPDEKIEDGWVIGRIFNFKIPNHQGKWCVNNGIENKKIDPDEFSYWVSKGYARGMMRIKISS